MAHDEYPITPAVRLLRERKIDFKPHLYKYQEHGGTRVGPWSSACRNTFWLRLWSWKRTSANL